MFPDSIIFGMVFGGIILSLGSYSTLAGQSKSATIDEGPAVVASAAVDRKHTRRQQNEARS
jgi:hypothetical protein